LFKGFIIGLGYVFNYNHDPATLIKERLMYKNFKELNFDNNPIIFFDVINQIEMLNLWRDIEKPKFDITSLGQFTGKV
jgi:hypothetical protein